MPRVSIITPTYNCAAFLPGALASALGQTYADFELLVVDDGSTDHTRAVMAGLDDRVRYLWQPNQGVSAARNHALRTARGELVAYLDADDAWRPEKLARQVAYLDAHPECALVHSDATFIDEAGAVLFPAYWRDVGRRAARGACLLELLRQNTIHMPSVLERRSALDETGGFDARARAAEDYLHWLQVALTGAPFGYLEEPLALYRKRAGSLSQDPRGMREGYVTAFEILLREGRLAARAGRPAAAITAARLTVLRLELAYLYRLADQPARARHHLWHEVQAAPLRLEPYRELLKTLLPGRAAAWLRQRRAAPNGAPAPTLDQRRGACPESR